MTREEIDQSLRQILTESAGIGKDILQPQASRVLAACASLLAIVMADQEHRLRVLEPCPERVVSGEPHVWGHFDVAPDALACRYCGITKEPAR